MSPKIGWYEFASILEYQEKKLVIYCENCEQIFFMREDTWDKFNGGTSFTLADLTFHAKCCEHPNWLFITNFFRPKRAKRANEIAKNFISALDEEVRMEYFWVDVI